MPKQPGQFGQLVNQSSLVKPACSILLVCPVAMLGQTVLTGLGDLQVVVLACLGVRNPSKSIKAHPAWPDWLTS